MVLLPILVLSPQRYKIRSLFLLKNYPTQHRNYKQSDYEVLSSQSLQKLLRQYIHNGVLEFFPIPGIPGDSYIGIED